MSSLSEHDNTHTELGSLSADEALILTECEATIDRGLQTFVEVGEALALVRDRKLYRAAHRTFEGYCSVRWNLSRSRAYQFIEAAGVADTLSTIVDTPLPASEAVARKLTVLKHEPETMVEVWQETIRDHGATPTAKQVAQHIEPRRETETKTETTGTVIDFPAVKESKPSGALTERQLAIRRGATRRVYAASSAAKPVRLVMDALQKDVRLAAEMDISEAFTDWDQALTDGLRALVELRSYIRAARPQRRSWAKDQMRICRMCNQPVEPRKDTPA